VHLELVGGAVVEADELLVATGRRPATDDLGVDAVGLIPGDHCGGKYAVEPVRGHHRPRGRAEGVDIDVVDLDIAVAGSAVHADGSTGKARMVVDRDRRAELLHSATIAVAGEVPVDRLWHAVPAFPTISEVWLRLLDAYGC